MSRLGDLVDRAAAFRRWAETFCERHASGDDEAVASLAHADADRYEPRAGWRTNGTVEQQERRMRLTGLDEEVDAWVISEGVGVKKLAPETFRIAAHAAADAAPSSARAPDPVARRRLPARPPGGNG